MEDWAPIRRVNLSEEIADRLTRHILSGRFKFGERLPTERDLAKYLDVGRPTVREAIRTLSVVGLVDVRPGGGTFVVDHHADFVAKAFSWTMLLDPRSMREVVEVRAAVESELARLASRRANDQQIATLRDLVTIMESAPDNADRFAAADVDFHMTVASAADNLSLNRLMEAIQSLLKQWVQRALTKPATFELALDQHRRIANAIQARDEDEAAVAARAHVESMGALVIKDAEDSGRPAGDNRRPVRRSDRTRPLPPSSHDRHTDEAK
jgi:GntR family transcriptional repressor for pyruvate dehydrogenase complex